MKLLSIVGRKKEEDIRNKQNGMEKKSAARRKVLRTEWVELLVRSGELRTTGHVIPGTAG